MPDRPVLSLDQFREAFTREGFGPKDAAIRAGFDTEVKAAEGESRRMTFTISTASVDRMGDTIAVEGWDLADFRKNPVVLWAHDQGAPPVGKATRVAVEKGKLVADVEFTPPGMSAFNDTVYAMLKGGFLNATSVGFLPTEWKFADDPGRRAGIDFLKQQLLEFSVVPVPANAEALVQARSLGIDLAPIAGWLEGVARAQNLALIPRARLDALEALPKKFRGIAKALPATAKAQSGQFRRCANDIEEALAIKAAPADPAKGEKPAEAQPRETPRLNEARARLDAIRRKLA